VDSAFSTINDHSGFTLCELDGYDPRLTTTSIALQHISNIWKRKNKGFRFRRPKQLRNYYAEPVNLEYRTMFDVNFDLFIQEEQQIRAKYYARHWNPFIRNHYIKKLRVGTPNVLGVERQKKYYDRKYVATSAYSAKAYTPVYIQVINLLKKHVAPDAVILEVGCGDGLLAGMLQKAGYTNYTGIDISESGIQAAKTRNPDLADSFFTGNAYELGDRGSQAETVIAIEVLEHIDDLKFIRGLKPGTTLIASVPNYWSSNNEHLRIYKSRNHIKWRFRKLLTFNAWARIQRTETRKIYVFVARVK
jgi:2-polyprenyl-3-methyl-5-hydroxy-6-metoxy-1,4-benzoquinol methylase